MLEILRYGDVEGLRVGRFGGRINTACILYRLGSTVIDSGPPNQWRSVRRFLRECGVERVAVTHHVMTSDSSVRIAQCGDSPLGC